MTRLTLPLICECLLFFVPLNIYVIGNDLAHGVQWALFRYQQSYLGNSLILIHKDFMYVADGILRGSSAYRPSSGSPGRFFSSPRSSLLALPPYRAQPAWYRPAGILTVTCGVLFFAAMIVEYGPTLANGHGSSVPVGVPLILVTGFWLVTGDFGAGEGFHRGGRS